MSQSGAPLGLRSLQPNLVANVDEFAQRSDVDGGLAQQDLDVGSAQLVNGVSRDQQPLNDVHVNLLPRPDMENAFTTDRVVVWRPIERADAAERIMSHRRDGYCKVRHHRLETAITSPDRQVVYCIRRAVGR